VLPTSTRASCAGTRHDFSCETAPSVVLIGGDAVGVDHSRLGAQERGPVHTRLLDPLEAPIGRPFIGMGEVEHDPAICVAPQLGGSDPVRLAAQRRLGRNAEDRPGWGRSAGRAPFASGVPASHVHPDVVATTYGTHSKKPLIINGKVALRGVSILWRVIVVNCTSVPTTESAASG
jgi:hypothetical protein